jgi:hypothetical protein
MSGLSVSAAYAPVAPVGSLVYVPGTSFSPAGSLSVSDRGYRGRIGVVRSYSRDVRSGRVLSLNCLWLTLDFGPAGSGPVSPRAVVAWSPGVGCGAGCAPVVGFGSSCAGCGYRS